MATLFVFPIILIILVIIPFLVGMYLSLLIMNPGEWRFNTALRLGVSYVLIFFISALLSWGLFAIIMSFFIADIENHRIFIDLLSVMSGFIFATWRLKYLIAHFIAPISWGKTLAISALNMTIVSIFVLIGSYIMLFGLFGGLFFFL